MRGSGVRWFGPLKSSLDTRSSLCARTTTTTAACVAVLPRCLCGVVGAERVSVPHSAASLTPHLGCRCARIAGGGVSPGSSAGGSGRSGFSTGALGPTGTLCGGGSTSGFRSREGNSGGSCRGRSGGGVAGPGGFSGGGVAGGIGSGCGCSGAFLGVVTLRSHAIRLPILLRRLPSARACP